MIHSTGFSNPRLNYFIWPSKLDPNRQDIIKLLGQHNKEFMDYNHTTHMQGYHF